MPSRRSAIGWSRARLDAMRMSASNRARSASSPARRVSIAWISRAAAMP
jgi:hypothetical protein